MVFGRKVKVEDSDDDEDQDFIQKLLKETEIKNVGASTNQKVEVNSISGADLI